MGVNTQKGYSNTVLEQCANLGIAISPLKLQKLIYISYGIALHNGVEADNVSMPFEAWTYGPVLVDIYHCYSYLKSKKIDTYMASEDGLIHTLKEEFATHVRKAVVTYGRLDGFELVDLLHKPDGAWFKAYKKSGNPKYIDHADIKKEFDHGK